MSYKNIPNWGDITETQIHHSWWRHQMETFFALLALCGDFPGHRWIPRTKASDVELWWFLCTSLNGWVNNCEAGDLRRHRAHHEVTAMQSKTRGSVAAYITDREYLLGYCCCHKFPCYFQCREGEGWNLNLQYGILSTSSIQLQI